MDIKTIGRGAMTDDDVLTLLSGERRYGAPELTTSAIYEQPIPKGFQPIAEELRAELHLSKLDDNANRTAIYNAYGHDIKLLGTYQDGFERFLKMAVRASTTDSGRNQWEKEWNFVSKSMPTLAHEPFINFSAEIAAMPEQELLQHLKAEMDAAVNKLFHIVCYWLDSLVAREYVGLLKITSDDAARYHYFRPLRTEKLLEKHEDNWQQVGYDGTKPFGQRTQYEQKSGSLVEITHDLERHDHDIVNMQVHTVADYPDMMPNRVIDFLERTPVFIRRHLSVVSGVIIREQVLKRTIGVEMEDTRHTSTWLGSPALTLAGVYVPVGWSDKDMKKSGFFFGQKACLPELTGLKKFALWCFKHKKGLIITNRILTLLVVIASVLLWKYNPEAGFDGLKKILGGLLFIQFMFWMFRKIKIT